MNSEHLNCDNLDSSSDTSPSAPSITSSTSQTVLTTHPRNVTKQLTRPISNIFDTSSAVGSSTSSTNRPPISEIRITPPPHSRSSPSRLLWSIYQTQILLQNT